MYLVGLVHGDSSGAGGSSCSGRGGHFQPPAPLSRKWRRLLRDPVRAPESLSCPEEASASELAQEVFLFLGDCLVLSVWPRRAFLSCLFSPRGLLIPPHFPREIFWGGVVRVPAVGAGPRGPRPRPRRPSAMASRAPSSAMTSRAPSPAMASRAPSSAMVPVCLFCSGGLRPVFLSVSVPRGLQSPPPVELLRLGTSLSGGGSNVSPLSCVSCVPASCVHIWFVSCPC